MVASAEEAQELVGISLTEPEGLGEAARVFVSPSGGGSAETAVVVFVYDTQDYVWSG